MTVRRLSLGFTIVGGALLVAAAALLVSISLGEGGTTSMDANGVEISSTYRTPSIMQDSPRVAMGWIAATLAVVLVVGLLIRYGGYIGPVLVIAVMSLAVLVSILTLGVFLAPGVALLCNAAVLAIADRAIERDSRRKSTRGTFDPSPRISQTDSSARA